MRSRQPVHWLSASQTDLSTRLEIVALAGQVGKVVSSHYLLVDLCCQQEADLQPFCQVAKSRLHTSMLSNEALQFMFLCRVQSSTSASTLL